MWVCHISTAQGISCDGLVLAGSGRELVLHHKPTLWGVPRYGGSVTQYGVINPKPVSHKPVLSISLQHATAENRLVRAR